MTDTNNDTGFIVNTNDENFQQDVFDRSRQVLVVVDFWAEWCSPCRMLGPILEKLAAEYNGRFWLIKADADAVPQAAAAFQVQSIPAVFAVLDGSLASSFTGALPEAQIRDWLDQVLGTAELEELEQLEQSDPAAAEQRYRQRVESRPDDAKAMIGLARVLLAQERLAEARDCVERLEARGFLEPEAEKIKSALGLHSKAVTDVDSLRTVVQQNPDNFPARFSLAEALAGAERYEEALEMCLELVQRDRAATGEQARLLMLDVFRVLPDDSPLISDFRRRLSLALY